MSAVDDETLFRLKQRSERECIGSQEREEETARTSYGTCVGYSYDTENRSTARTPTLQTAPSLDKQQDATKLGGYFFQSVDDVTSGKRVSTQTVAEDGDLRNSSSSFGGGGNSWSVEPVGSTAAISATRATASVFENNTGPGLSQDGTVLLLRRGGTTSAAAAAAAAATNTEVNGAERSGTAATLSPIAHLAVDDPLATGALDDWKDYSCSTAWEHFINDVDNAIGELEGGERGATGNRGKAGEEEGEEPARGRRRLRQRLSVPLTYDGRPYVLRRVQHSRGRDLRQAAASPDSLSTCERTTSPVDCRGGAMEFPRLPRFVDNEERALDILVGVTRPEDSAASEGELIVDEALRMLGSWFELGDFFCLHESTSGRMWMSSLYSKGDGSSLPLEQLLSTGVLAMEDRRCCAMLALERPQTSRRDSKPQGVSVKGYVTLSSPSSTGDFARWTRRAESIRLEGATSSNLPPERQSLEAFGELLEDKALASWGERGAGGRLEASARYTWERRLDDGRFMGGDSAGRQTEWRNFFWRERSHRRRGPRDRALRALLAEAVGEDGVPAWGPVEDPLNRVRVTVLWDGLGGGLPLLPNAPVETLNSAFLLEGEDDVEWTASVSWSEDSNSWDSRDREASLGFKLRLLLAAYVHCLALDGDVLMADVGVGGADTEANDSFPSREQARHIGAVLGPRTRELIDRMKMAPRLPRDTGSSGAGGDDHGEGLKGAEPAEIVNAARYLLTPRRRTPPSYYSHRGSFSGTMVNGGGTWHPPPPPPQQQQQQQQHPPTMLPSAVVPDTPTQGDESGPTPAKRSAEGFSSRVQGVNATPNSREERSTCPSVVPWLWVPRGGSPACRLVSQVAREAARFGAQGICLGDIAAFWKSFVLELRFLWEEGAFVPSMEPEPPVDGYSMYDPVSSGQDAALSAFFRRHVYASALSAAAAASPVGGADSVAATSGGVRAKGGLSFEEGVVSSPPPPDMRTSLLHQKLQMLNCCVAEQSRTRAFASSVIASPSAAAAATTAKDGGKMNGGRSGGTEGTSNVKAMTVPKYVSKGVGGKGGEEGVEAAAVPETAEERSARMKASFAAERDAILRRVGVVKKREGVANASGGVGGRGGEGGGGPWWLIGQGGRGRRGEDEKHREAATVVPEPEQKTEPPTSPASLSGGGRVNQHAAEGVDSGDGSRARSTDLAVSQGKDKDDIGDDDDDGGLSRAAMMGSEVEWRDVGGGGGKRRGRRAVERLGGVVKKVGGGAVRKVGGAVWKVGEVVVGGGGGGGGGGKRVRDQDRSTKRAVEDEQDGSGGDGRGRGLDGASAGEVPSGSADGAETVEAWDGVGGENSGVTVEGKEDRVDGEETSSAAGEIGTGAAYAVAADGDDGDGAGRAFTGERLLATRGRVVVPELLPGCPLTSDMLEQQRELARRLSFRPNSDGTTKAEAEAAHKARVSRVRLATLAADMRCFLLSNPGAVFADFVRWYSPPNWRTYGVGYGRADGPLGGGSSSARDSTLKIVVEIVDGILEQVVEGSSIRRARGGVADARASSGDGDVIDTTVETSSLSLASASFPSASPSLSAPGVGNFLSLEGGGGAPPSWRIFLPKLSARSCKLVWEHQGEIVWRSMSHGSDGIDQEEGVEWMEAWLEVERALAAAGDSGGGKDPETCRPPRPLFSPSQEAEKALHYLETIGPAPLVSQLLLALACTAGFVLSEAQTDAVELPCVRGAVRRVNAAIATASEGLSEASAAGGVLLMGNRVAQPVSQATLVACDALCDAVDEAEVLLSRGTSLLHKLPGEIELVEALVIGGVANGCRTRNPTEIERRASGAKGGKSGLAALARYLSCDDPGFSSPTSLDGTTEDNIRNMQGTDGNASPGVSRGEGGLQTDSGGSNRVEEASAVVDAIAAVAASTPRINASSDRNPMDMMPGERVREYSIRWRLPAVVSRREARECNNKRVVEKKGDEEIGARLYARVTDGGSGEEREGGARVRVAFSLAEPARVDLR